MLQLIYMRVLTCCLGLVSFSLSALALEHIHSHHTLIQNPLFSNKSTTSQRFTTLFANYSWNNLLTTVVISPWNQPFIFYLLQIEFQTVNVRSLSLLFAENQHFSGLFVLWFNRSWTKIYFRVCFIIWVRVFKDLSVNLSAAGGCLSRSRGTTLLFDQGWCL